MQVVHQIFRHTGGQEDPDIQLDFSLSTDIKEIPWKLRELKIKDISENCALKWKGAVSESYFLAQIIVHNYFTKCRPSCSRARDVLKVLDPPKF